MLTHDSTAAGQLSGPDGGEGVRGSAKNAGSAKHATCASASPALR